LAGALNRASLLAGTFSKKHLAGKFQKSFGGKISKEHLAGTFWREHFGGNILAGTFWREHFGGNFKYFFSLRKL
jgi:hypothetical protein